MIISDTIEIGGVGPVLFERSKRAKHLKIVVGSIDRIRVAVPRGISFAVAERFVREKTGWIQKHQAWMEQWVRENSFIYGNTLKINKREAKKRLVSRLDELAEKHGFTYNRVFIRDQKTRWGSCSHKNNISLNIKLIRIADELIDYVILHELLHTRIKNHKKSFWKELDDILAGNANILDFRLKKYHLELL